MCRFVFGSTCNERLDFPMIQWKNSKHWLGIVALTPYICLDIFSRMHSEFFIYSLWEKTHQPSYNRNCSNWQRVIREEGLYPSGLHRKCFFSLEFPIFRMTEFTSVMGVSFISVRVQMNPAWIAISKFIKSSNRHDTREIVLVMVVLCVLFRIFFFELYQDCRSTSVASQKLSIPWFIIALHCKNEEGCLSSISFIDCSKKDHE